MVQLINTPPNGIFSYLGYKSHQQTMEPVEIKILKYTFRFRELSWREETSIKFEPGEDRMRTVLAHAMTEVSGLKVNSPEEAKKVLNAIPATVIQRMVILWRGHYPAPRRFSTTGLYQAPATEVVARRMKEVEAQREQVMDKVETEMRQKFGDKEVQEALELERLMLKNSKMRGATRASEDIAPEELDRRINEKREKLFGQTPPRPGTKR